MGYTLEQYEALKKSIAQGVMEVMYGDKRIIYRSLNEMKVILSDMERELGLSNKPMIRYVPFSKGLK